MMNTTDILQSIMADTGWTASELARHMGIDKSSVAKVLRGERSMGSDLLAKGLERAGFTVRVERSAPFDPSPTDELHGLLAELRRPIDQRLIDNGMTWRSLSSRLDDLFHASDRDDQCIAFTQASYGIRDHRWLATLAGIYRHLRWGDGTSRHLMATTATSVGRRYRLASPWSPLPTGIIDHERERSSRRGKQPDTTFSQGFLIYNVLIPTADLPDESTPTNGIGTNGGTAWQRTDIL
ncbi:helix-turn-helix domain-containing protein [Bifidobacterium stellenboschense]|uniref:Fis family transcriptional regulator n=1 Tax=Bifidobacterium stellenboschense TaxID=762211 RepID=A0A087DQV2_9BIFI|nr:helix-turn-helix transcriptional regulator [Bifidobacterium stellenboschense]KFI97902.1 Fis family transcriptional regulator [Bifidobacterium stellenboschense]